MMDERIIELEKKAAFQQHLLDELNDALVQQQKRFDLLEKRLRLLTDQVQTGDFMKKPEEETPPPHY